MSPRETTAGMTSILVPVDGSDASMDAVALACNIAKRNKGEVYVVHAIEVHRSLPLDAELQPEAARGEEILARAEQVARQFNSGVEGELLQTREAGHAIVDEAAERGVDLIILGIGHKGPFGEFQLGKLAQHILKHASCHVWVCRHPVQES